MFFSEGKQGHNRSGGDQSPEETGEAEGREATVRMQYERRLNNNKNIE